ncbi:MAG: tryptophan synthase subunit alpha [Legionellales bacterium]|nr:MAG: tryptophan synthase subunit alpha [Legionellales bacterium]
MDRFKHAFANGKAFVSYSVVGQDGLAHSKKCVLALIKAGVSILEIGVPFSDPVADGPVIQKAMQDALKRDTNIFDVLKLISEIRESSDIPIVLFTYYNPILNADCKDIYAKIAAAGVDAILIVDLPLEEADEHQTNCNRVAIKPIYLVSPVTPEPRIKQIAAQNGAFIYYVCRKGTTGIKSDLPKDLAEKIQQIKQITSIPVIAGFGIANKTTAKAVLEHADGFVVGSLLVKTIQAGASPNELARIAKSVDPR